MSALTTGLWTFLKRTRLFAGVSIRIGVIAALRQRARRKNVFVSITNSKKSARDISRLSVALVRWYQQTAC